MKIRKLFLLSTFIFLTIFLCGFTREPKGFRNMKRCESLDELINKGANMYKIRAHTYRIRNDIKYYLGAQVSEINYSFCQNKLCRVYIRIKGWKNNRKIRDAINKLHGDPYKDGKKIDGYFGYWKGKRGRITLTITGIYPCIGVLIYDFRSLCSD